MRILTFSSLYPNARQPSHGIFVENRLRQLLAYSDRVEARVVAPVPWFPFASPMFGSYAAYAAVAARENRHGIEVFHPRYPVIPKVGMRLAPQLMYAAVRRWMRRRVPHGYDFDLIDAHYFYPDGVVAMWLAADAGKPFVVTARGSDINLIPRYPAPRRWIKKTVGEASHVMTVSAALRSRLIELGAEEGKATVLRNGVDLDFFHPAHDRVAVRRELGFDDRPLVLSVGNLVELKGHHLVIDAMCKLQDMCLQIVGGGELEHALGRQVERLGLGNRVGFAGRIPPARLLKYFQAADVLVLASSREGWANVLLEAMACGTPVVATPVGGNPEVVGDAAAGELAAERNADALVAAVQKLFARHPERSSTRAYAERFSWDDTSQGQIDIFERVIAEHAGRQPC